MVLYAGDVPTAADLNPATPKLGVFSRLAVQSVPNAAYTGLLFDTEVIDTEHGHSTSVNVNIYQVMVTGWYLLQGTVSFASNTTGLRIAAFLINSIPQTQGATQIPTVTTGGSGTIVTATGMYYMVAGDSLELGAYQTTGAGLNVSGYLSLMYVSA